MAMISEKRAGTPDRPPTYRFLGGRVRPLVLAFSCVAPQSFGAAAWAPRTLIRGHAARLLPRRAHRHRGRGRGGDRRHSTPARRGPGLAGGGHRGGQGDHPPGPPPPFGDHSGGAGPAPPRNVPPWGPPAGRPGPEP